MTTYIKGMGNISPQQTWDDSVLLNKPLVYHDDKLKCHEPDYTQYIDPKQLRRMSRVIKMGVAAGSMALKQAGLSVPNGIITGTAYGCLEDTGIFLNKMIENNEHALNPTPFIQSTHNTIGSQIALLLQCQGYNQTYTQGAFSFESALLDGMLELKDAPDQSLLVGGVDEITSTSHAIQRRFGIFRKAMNNMDLFQSKEKGTLNGEGAAYFVLSGEKGMNDKVCIEAVKTLFKPTESDLHHEIISFLEMASAKPNDIDLVLAGKSGDQSFGTDTDKILEAFFPASTIGLFKHLCGEFPTASAFALWLGAKIIQENYLPAAVVFRNNSRPINRLLIYNPYFGTHHSLILLRAC
ncbi:beta-ketoacyl synthase N-terminal-like domain-containing protein [Chryseolinea sp. H1M3-3]|uniref:beta-ketoacyl synthase N-terminal-like domain-containing protein n=1 Tax=Chryseolinea sp. H1M3-3 TaxID=3034144 RepID=UPI0023EBBF5B|nr:beta-ketoacyl synthase N-terminal-like domain-containing protein [Chryseolinea sp. H1M3-3]